MEKYGMIMDFKPLNSIMSNSLFLWIVEFLWILRRRTQFSSQISQIVQKKIKNRVDKFGSRLFGLELSYINKPFY